MYIARQPIFDTEMNVYGYELLYRDDRGSTSFGSADSDRSTATVLGGLFETGIDQIVGDKKAFVNFDQNFLNSESIRLIDPVTLIIEVLEDTVFDDAVISRISELRSLGYKIALDDFEYSEDTCHAENHADMIKFDPILTPLDEIKNQVSRALSQKKILVAEKIEDQDTYLKARKMGFQLFQGYFFSRPKIVAGLKSKKSGKAIYQHLLSELHSEEPSFHRLASIIEKDVDMAYRVVKIGGNNKARDNSIRSILTRMGLSELERWVSVLMILDLSADKPRELIRLSLLRSRFGELIAQHSNLKSRRHEVSLMCLFSVLDAMLDMPMNEAVENLSVSEDIKDVLIRGEGPFAPVHDIIRFYETGEGTPVCISSEKLDIDQGELFRWYIQSIEWSDRMMKIISSNS